MANSLPACPAPPGKGFFLYMRLRIDNRAAAMILMIRKAFKMAVHPERHAEYERRHRPIWPKLEETLRAHGVRNYSIFLDEQTSELFACVECESEERWNAIAQTEVCRGWWQFMREIMPSNPDNSPVSRELREVFRLE